MKDVIKSVAARSIDPHMVDFIATASPANLLHRLRFSQNGDPILRGLNQRALRAEVGVMRKDMGEYRFGILSRKVGFPDLRILSGSQRLAKAARRRARRIEK